MTGYKYKIQWTFNNLKDFNKCIRLLGAQSLDIIYLRNKDNKKILDSYSRMIMYPNGPIGNDKTIKYIKKHFDNITMYIEVLRR